MDAAPKRIYVKILAEFDDAGKITPLRLELPDGRRYEIDRLVRVERLAPQTGGGGILRYEVRVYGKTRYLWRDGDRWFVEVASP